VAVNAKRYEILHSVLAAIDVMDFNFLVGVPTNLTSGTVPFQHVEIKSTEAVATSKFNTFLKCVYQMLFAKWSTIHGGFFAELTQPILHPVVTQVTSLLTVFQKMFSAKRGGSGIERSLTLRANTRPLSCFAPLLGTFSCSLKTNVTGGVSIPGGASARANSLGVIDGSFYLVERYAKKFSGFLHATLLFVSTINSCYFLLVHSLGHNRFPCLRGGISDTQLLYNTFQR